MASQKMIKAPAIFLSFDDCQIGQWYKAIPLFKEYKAKITFYLSYITLITEKEWEMIKKLENAGHTIAFHGTYHLNAGKLIPKAGCKKFVDEEILPGIEILRKQGFNDIRSYSYPFGNDNSKAKKCLSKYFDTLRTVGFHLYAEDEIGKKLKDIQSYNLAKIPFKRKDKNFKIISRIAEEKKIFFGHMHKTRGKELPIKGECSAHKILQKVLARGEKEGVKFLSMREFNEL